MVLRYSLLDQPWLPVRRESGVIEHIRPRDVTSGLGDDPVVGFAWPRADFDAAAREFMIGLLSTACSSAIVDFEAWEAWWEEPPEPATVEKAIAPLATAFVVDGDGPRFMQDLDPLIDGKEWELEKLLIGSPGKSAIEQNKDFFVKRGRTSTIGRGAAAMALFTLQTFASSGGTGHRTSLRGGGPLTTLVVSNAPGRDRLPTLWHLLWTNVSWDEDWPDPRHDLEAVFPWLAPTRLSHAGQVTTPLDVHPAQAFWGMPRRIRLDFVANERNEPCSLTGRVDDVRVSTYRTRPHGHNYEAWNRAHPLTPYYRTKATSLEWLPVHPQPGRLGYRDWVGLVAQDASDDTATRMPAKAVIEARHRLSYVGNPGAVRLLASGFDMEKDKARGFVESQMPLHLFTEKVALHAELLIRNMVLAARQAADALSYQVGRAESPRDVPGPDKGNRHLAAARFWEGTEPRFFRRIDSLSEKLAPVVEDQDSRELVLQDSCSDWLNVLRRTALSVFDAVVSLDAFDSLDFRALEQRVPARRDLVSTFHGRNKSGVALFRTLRLPLPERKAEKSRKNASKETAL